MFGADAASGDVRSEIIFAPDGGAAEGESAGALIGPQADQPRPSQPRTDAGTSSAAGTHMKGGRSASVIGTPA